MTPGAHERGPCMDTRHAPRPLTARAAARCAPQGFGWAIAKALAEAGAEISLGVWVSAMRRRECGPLSLCLEGLLPIGLAAAAAGEIGARQRALAAVAATRRRGGRAAGGGVGGGCAHGHAAPGPGAPRPPHSRRPLRRNSARAPPPQVPALNIFETSFRRGKFDESRKLANGGLMEFSHIYPMDAVFDTPDDVPEEVGVWMFLGIYLDL